MKAVPDKDDVHSQIHAGRRKKLRARFVKDELKTFNECEVLEFALGFAMPRCDTNPMAHRLINKFGTLTKVIDASPKDLENIIGIGKYAAVFLSFLKQFTTYVTGLSTKQTQITSPDKAIDYLKPLMKTYSVEQLVILCLDKAGRVLIMDTITSNELDKIHLNMRGIIQMVLSVKTASVILSHNHLNEDPSPSTADMNLTRKLMSIFNVLNIDLTDHIIFASNDHYSFASSGLIHTFKKDILHK